MTDPLFTENPQIKAIAAALFGGFISKRFRRNMKIGEWIVALVSVCGMAIIFAQPIVDYFNGSPSTLLVVGCMIGAFGIPIFESILEAIKNGIVADFLRSRF